MNDCVLMEKDIADKTVDIRSILQFADSIAKLSSDTVETEYTASTAAESQPEFSHMVQAHLSSISVKLEAIIHEWHAIITNYRNGQIYKDNFAAKCDALGNFKAAI